jgi:hypothetical protein
MTGKITDQNDSEYLSAVLRLYLELPETPSKASANDKKTATELYIRGIKLTTVESALLLASLRRLNRPHNMPPLSPIRSLAYFFPVIQEILDNPIPVDYLEYLRRKVALLSGKRGMIPNCGLPADVQKNAFSRDR